MNSKINRRERLEKQLEVIKARLQSVKAREKTSERKKMLEEKYWLEHITLIMLKRMVLWKKLKS